VAVRGPDAAGFLDRMLSNEIEGLAVGGSCEAMLLTPKARVIALLVVYRRTDDDFLLLTDAGLDAIVAQTLLRARFAAKVEVETEEHSSYVLLDAADEDAGGAIVIESHEFGPGREVVGAAPPAALYKLSSEEAEVRRIAAGMPRFGREIDDRVLPAEAGLVERTVSFDKGCYPGQEPIARLHYRGHTNRGLRVLRLETDVAPAFDAEVSYEDKVVGRVTSAAVRDGEVVALAYVRNEVPADAIVEVDGLRASMIEPSRP
jgi:folate-binding protein YgfZ